MSGPKPNTPAPALAVETVGGGTWKLSEQTPGAFTMIAFYRGAHCPICRTYLQELERNADELKRLGVEIIAVSGDDRERAEKAKSEWGLENVPVGYGQTIESMRDWGLFVSGAIKEAEPRQFGEPGVFLVKPDGTFYGGGVNTFPFARPRIEDVLGAIRFILDRDYPPRGEA